MKKIFFFLFILIFSSEIQLFAQNKISSSVLQSDNFERTFPEPYYDDKLETFGWSSDGKLYFAIHNYGYSEEELEMPTQYFLVDIATNTLLFYDTTQNKNLQKEHHIKINAELKQFPLIITNDSGELLDKIDLNNSLNNREGQQSLTFSSTKKGEILIKSSEEMSDIDLGCPDEVKGYFLSPDEKYLLAVFYSNSRITGAGGDPCEGSIYFKVLDMKKFETIKKDKSFDELITRFWDSYWNPERYLIQEDLYDDDGPETQPLYDNFIYFEKVLISLGKDDKVDGIILTDTITVLDFDSADDFWEFKYDEIITVYTYINYFRALKKLNLSIDGCYVDFIKLKLTNFELEYLKLYNPDIESLDISRLKKLKFLSLGNNSLKSLDISQNTALTTLYCHDNELSSLDISKNPKLQTLYCDRNQIKTLDISNSPNLTKLRCFNNGGCVRIDKTNDRNWSNCISSREDGADYNVYPNEFIDPETEETCFCQDAVDIAVWEYEIDKLTNEQKDCWCFELKKEVAKRALMLKGNTLMNTDPYELINSEQSNIYYYDNTSYEIITTAHKETNGYVITIGNIEKESAFTIGEEWGLYFQGLIGHYMIIDEGTGTMRDLSVYDLQEQKVVFKTGYVGSLEVIEGKIHFLDQVQLQKESEKPECPQELIDIGYGIGYVEKMIYNLNKKSLIKTGVYECYYFE
ncbi:MAG: hypothetical protein P8I93_00770 [Crocinitomicaceae bacterium]|nr:hypothetical protein [Crocinitomicaceae bacterium]